MEKIKIKPVVYSQQYTLDTEDIYNYGAETFGLSQALKFETFFDHITSELSNNYLMYPECRWLLTKGRIYRNIILDSHLIIYRIKNEKIEVLRALHSHSSITKIKGTRSIKL
jgi:toxin ParE1/3/4